MAIKINGLTVIDDSRNISNVFNMEGLYSAFSTTAIVITNTITFENPVTTCTMSADTTFSESGATAGLTCTLLLDTTSTAYTPTFTSNINWENNTEPTWSAYRRWQITFHCDTSDDIRATAVGFTAQGGGSGSSIPTAASDPAVTLTGRTSSYVGDLFGSDYDFDSGGAAQSASGADIDFRFTNNNGDFKIEIRGDADGNDNPTAEWINQSNTRANLSATNFTTIYTNTTAPTALKMVWTESALPDTTEGQNAYYTATSNSGSYTNNTWHNVPSSGNYINLNFDISTMADDDANNPINQSDTYIETISVEFWGRASGYDDTLLVTFTAYLLAEADIV